MRYFPSSLCSAATPVSALLLLMWLGSAAASGDHDDDACVNGPCASPGTEKDEVTLLSLHRRQGVGAPAGSDKVEYTVMVDCGSSGTRVLVYKGHAGSANLTEVVAETGPIEGVALSSFNTKPREAGPMMQELVNQSLPLVPEADWSTTPVYAYATAGLRSESVLQAAAIWRSVRTHLSMTPYKFEPQYAATLSGTVEGVNQVVTVNQILVQYGGKEPSRDGVAGIIEMGGASLQAAFRPLTSILDQQFSISMEIRDEFETFELFSNSWLGFGGSQALQRSCVSLNESGRTENPCLLKGPSYAINLDISGPVECENVEDYTCVNFTGGSDPVECAKLVKSLLHTDYECVQEPCSIMGDYFPRAVGTFIGVSNFFYTASNLGLIGWDEAKPVPVQQILDSADQLCSLTKEEAERTPPFNCTTCTWDNMWTACFRGYFVPAIVEAFGLNRKGTELIYARKLYGQELSWTRGGAYFARNSPPTVRNFPMITPM